MAERAAAFGMSIIATDPVVTAERAQAVGAELCDLEELVRRADFITLHLPNTPDTQNLIDAATIALMKPGVHIINAARGGIVNEAALADAVASGHVAGAAIDVFATEPTTASPLFELDNIVVPRI